MELHEMAGHLIRRLNQRSTRVFQAHTKAAGFELTPVQFAAMGAIAANPGIDQARVATLIAYDRATIGGVIERLVQKGYARRSVSRRDRRAHEVRLTGAGEQVYAEVLPVVGAFQPEILDGLTPEEQAAFLALARKAVSAESEPG